MSWKWSQIAEIGVLSPRNDAPDEADASFVPMQMIAAEYGTPNVHEVRTWAAIKTGYTHFSEGDVGLAKITPCFENGKSTVFRNLTGGFGSGTTELHVVRPLLVVQNYVLIFLKSPYFIQTGIPKMTGTAGQKRVPPEHFAHAPFPLPPLAEQHRIVAKVDELMALCDALEAGTYEAIEAHELLVENLLATLTDSDSAEALAESWARIETHFDTLFTTEASIDQLKQTILQLAVMGKLVRQSLTEDRSNQNKLRPDDNAEAYDLKSFRVRAMKFPLPSNWTIEPLSRISSHVVDCPHTTPKWTDEGYLCAKSEQIMAGYLDLTNPNYVSEETYIERIERLKPEPNDILFKREGGILGVACRIPQGLELCLGQRLMLIRANELISAEFLDLVLNSPWITDYASEKTTGGAAPRVNMAIVRGFPIPVPPMAEQRRILEMFNGLSSLCDLLKSKLSSARTAEIVLADAVASKAVV